MCFGMGSSHAITAQKTTVSPKMGPAQRVRRRISNVPLLRVSVPLTSNIVKFLTKSRDQRQQAISVRAVARSGWRTCRPVGGGTVLTRSLRVNVESRPRNRLYGPVSPPLNGLPIDIMAKVRMLVLAARWKRQLESTIWLPTRRSCVLSPPEQRFDRDWRTTGE